MRVILADDSVLLREGLARMLSESGFEVVAQVGDAEALLAAVDADPPDVCIVDIRMPPTNTTEGLRAALHLRVHHPRVAVLVLSQYVETRYAMELLAQGADGVGYLLKDRVGDVSELLVALRSVVAGRSVIDPTVVSRLVGRRRRQADPVETLTAFARTRVEPHWVRGGTRAGEGQSRARWSGTRCRGQLGCRPRRVAAVAEARDSARGLDFGDGASGTHGPRVGNGRRDFERQRRSSTTGAASSSRARRVPDLASQLPARAAARGHQLGSPDWHDAAQIESRIPKGLVVRTKRVGATTLRRRAEQLASADLRSRDREDDALLNGDAVDVERDWLRADVNADAELSARLATIR